MIVEFIARNIKFSISAIILLKNAISNYKIPSQNSLNLTDSCCKTMESNFSEQVSKELFNCIEDLRTELKIPSLQVLLALNEELKFNCSTGFSNIKKQQKTNLDNIYYLGSLSKIYVQAIILKLAQDNILSLEDPVLKYIDISPQGTNVKIKHLLFHSSGIYDVLKNRIYKFKTYYLKKIRTTDDFIKELRKHKSSFIPDTKHEYSNAGYVLLGIIAEKATNKTFSVLLKEYILYPLKLKNTYYSYQDKLPECIAVGYDKDIYGFNKTKIIASVEEFPVNLPTLSFTAGGIVANTSDFFKFISDFSKGNILEGKFKRMFRLLLYKGKKVSKINLKVFEGHIVGYSSFYGYSSNKKVDIVILSNLSNTYDGNNITDNIVEKIVNIIVNNNLIQSKHNLNSQ